MSSTASDQARAQTIVLIHGMWMTPLSWEHWASHYHDRGYHVLAPVWPGLEAEPEQLRRDPSPLRNLSIADVVDHYETIIRGLERPPIIIGHSFGGLFTQLLADRGLGAAAVALGTGAPKGVLRLPYSTIRAAWPALGRTTTSDPIPVRPQRLAIHARRLQLEHLTLLDHDHDLLDRLRDPGISALAGLQIIDHLSLAEGVTGSGRLRRACRDRTGDLQLEILNLPGRRESGVSQEGLIKPLPLMKESRALVTGRTL